MDKESGDNSVNAPVERQQTGDSGLQAQMQSSQVEMANLGSQRNADSAQASQQMADQGLVNNLQLTGDVNSGKDNKSNQSNDSAANSAHATQDGRNPWANELKTFGSYASDTSFHTTSSTQRDYAERNPEAKSHMDVKGQTSENTSSSGVSNSEFDAKPPSTDAPKTGQDGKPSDGIDRPNSNDNGKPVEGESKNRDWSQLESPDPSEPNGRPNAESQVNPGGSSSAEHSEPAKVDKSERPRNQQPAPHQQPAPRQQPGPVHRPAPVGRPTW